MSLLLIWQINLPFSNPKCLSSMCLVHDCLLSSFLSTYIVVRNHGVFRVPGFLSNRPNWVPPFPHLQGSVALPPFGSRGDTLAGWGGGGDPIPMKGQRLWYSMVTIIPLHT